MLIRKHGFLILCESFCSFIKQVKHAQSYLNVYVSLLLILSTSFIKNRLTFSGCLANRIVFNKFISMPKIHTQKSFKAFTPFDTTGLFLYPQKKCCESLLEVFILFLGGLKLFVNSWNIDLFFGNRAWERAD